MEHQELMDRSNEVLRQGREAIARLDRIINKKEVANNANHQ